MKRGSRGWRDGEQPGGRVGSVGGFFLLAVLLALAFSVAAQAAARPGTAALSASPSLVAESRYAIEISISGRTLVLYERAAGGKRVPLRQYRVGSAVLGLDVYPLGRGRVTAIAFNPWWYPTPYSREVFRQRGIALPAQVPPGHPLNYMGPVKISLSHRTRKGAIYRIHGNNNPARVGRRVTGGCFVMDNSDALQLARTISVGTDVTILP